MNRLFKKDYFGYVYEWYDEKRDMYYRGSHFGDVNDSYCGSNKRFLNALKKRPESFTFKVLEYISENSHQSVLEAEQVWLDDVPDIKSNDDFYNKKNEALGGWSFISDKHIKLRAKTLKSRHRRFGLSNKELTSYETKTQTKQNRWENIGFSLKEKEQHQKYGIKVKVINSNNQESIFYSISEASRVTGLDIAYALQVTTRGCSYKGIKAYKLSSPIIDCRSTK